MLVFNEKEHTYTLNGIPVPSVSSIVSQYKQPFDANKVAGFMERAGKGSKASLLAQWKAKADESIKKGNALHLIGELIAAAKSNNYPIFSLLQFWQDLEVKYEGGYTIEGIEEKVYSLIYMYAGIADLRIYSDKDEEYHLYDYKTNVDLFKNYKGNKMQAPFNKFLDTPCNHYFVQQNLYKIALEEQFKQVDKMYLVWLKEENYELIEVPDLTEIIEECLQ